MALSEKFMLALQEGHLVDLRTLLLTDRTLCPEIRRETLTIYYRGKSLLKVEEIDDAFVPSFSANYYLKDLESWYQKWVEQVKNLPDSVNTTEEATAWIEIVPLIKAVMDRWFSINGGLEREAQQLIVQENNRDGNYARATDYYFCDMERAENKIVVEEKPRGIRFDLVGVHWPSTIAEKKNPNNRTLLIAEVKYGDGAHAGDSGLVDHYRGLQAFVAAENRLGDLKDAMLSAFQQKHTLGLIECQNPLESFSKKLTWLIILINHDPEKSGLIEELKHLNNVAQESNESSIQIQVATSNFMGYGLWDQAIIDLGEFLKTNKSRIYCH